MVVALSDTEMSRQTVLPPVVYEKGVAAFKKMYQQVLQASYTIQQVTGLCMHPVSGSSYGTVIGLFCDSSLGEGL